MSEEHDKLLEAWYKADKMLRATMALIRAGVPYEEWPKELQIAGIDEELLGPKDE